MPQLLRPVFRLMANKTHITATNSTTTKEQRIQVICDRRMVTLAYGHTEGFLKDRYGNSLT